MDLSETSAPAQSHDMGQASAILCPTLTSLHVEGLDPTERRELIPVLEAVVTCCAAGGSPLKTFTFYYFEECQRKWELIGSNGSFVVKMVDLGWAFWPFKLDISLDEDGL